MMILWRPHTGNSICPHRDSGYLTASVLPGRRFLNSHRSPTGIALPQFSKSGAVNARADTVAWRRTKGCLASSFGGQSLRQNREFPVDCHLFYSSSWRCSPTGRFNSQLPRVGAFAGPEPSVPVAYFRAGRHRRRGRHSAVVCGCGYGFSTELREVLSIDSLSSVRAKVITRLVERLPDG